MRQVYALAGALCERAGEAYPRTRAEASALIERLRTENGHPAPRLEDAPFRPRRETLRPGSRVHDERASDVSAKLVNEMR